MNVELTQAIKDDIFGRTRDAAYHIIERKGATYYAIGAGLVEVVKAIVRDENAILPVGNLIDGFHGISGVSFGMPTIVNRDGATKMLPLPLNESEVEALKKSADVLTQALQNVV